MGHAQPCSFPTYCSQLTSVDDLLDDLGYLALEQRVEHLDEEDKAGAQEHQGASQQDEPHGQVRQPRVHKDVIACRGNTELLRADPLRSSPLVTSGAVSLGLHMAP